MSDKSERVDSANLPRFLNKVFKRVVCKYHVHLLVSEPPTKVPSKIMRRIKGRSPMKVFESYLVKKYWGASLWSSKLFLYDIG